MNPLVSVVVPAFNAQKYLGETLHSIARQTFRPLELLVVDDGSADETAAIARRFRDEFDAENFRVVVLEQENSGTSVARNHAISHARGEFLAFCDADDVWENHKTETQLRALQNGQHDAATALIAPFWSPEIPPEKRHNVPMMAPSPHGITAFLIRRAAFERVGFFKEDQKAEWIEWMIRAKENNVSILEMPEILGHRRIHESNTSRQNSEVRLEILKAALDRRRAAQNAQHTVSEKCDALPVKTPHTGGRDSE